MGACLSQEPDVDFDGPVDFNHFHILRAIGKGAFGKVCIVKKKDTKQMYAMKYMNKVQIIRKHAVENVFREIKILRSLEHSFLVNLWFSFQDREDMFMVLDLMLGGDISYHLEKAGRFSVPRVRLYIAELSLALEYLRSKNIIHRDVKPANMLLDSQGHVHVTDFNVATIVKPNSTISSVTGTKPYMAPEVLKAPSRGYTYAVDWWSLGVSAYEMLRGHRPFNIEKNMSNSAIHNMLMHTRPSASASWDQNTCDVLKMLLHPDEDKRLHTATSIRKHPFFEELKWKEVEQKKITPSFIPPQNRINCDPTHELEEMIVEPNPLHKKRDRLSKRNFRSQDVEIEEELEKINRQFKEYNRQRENEAALQAEAEKKEELAAAAQGLSLDENASHPKTNNLEVKGGKGGAVELIPSVEVKDEIKDEKAEIQHEEIKVQDEAKAQDVKVEVQDKEDTRVKVQDKEDTRVKVQDKGDSMAEVQDEKQNGGEHKEVKGQDEAVIVKSGGGSESNLNNQVTGANEIIPNQDSELLISTVAIIDDGETRNDTDGSTPLEGTTSNEKDRTLTTDVSDDQRALLPNL